MTKKLIESPSSGEDIKHYILDWHQFIIDYWWRKRYNIPFGSPAHRAMNFIDMAIEYKEAELISKMYEKSEAAAQEREDAELGIVHSSDEVKMSKEQIDEDYNNLDLSQFDK